MLRVIIKDDKSWRIEYIAVRDLEIFAVNTLNKLLFFSF